MRQWPGQSAMSRARPVCPRQLPRGRLQAMDTSVTGRAGASARPRRRSDIGRTSSRALWYQVQLRRSASWSATSRIRSSPVRLAGSPTCSNEMATRCSRELGRGSRTRAARGGGPPFAHRSTGSPSFPARATTERISPRSCARGGPSSCSIDRSPGSRPTPCLVDNRAGAARAVLHLALLGHRRIGLVGHSPGIASTAERIDGYRSALSVVGAADPTDALVSLGGSTIDEGHRSALRLLQRPTAPPRSSPSTTS